MRFLIIWPLIPVATVATASRGGAIPLVAGLLRRRLVFAAFAGGSPVLNQQGLGWKIRASMVDRNLLREFDVSDEELIAAVSGPGSSVADADPEQLFAGAGQSFEIGSIVQGKVVEVVGDQVVVDIGYKSEGLVPLNEWEDEDPPHSGQEVEVLLEGMEDETGEIVLSRRKATACAPGKP